MSAQITKDGFNEIIQKIKNEWKYVELRELNSSDVDVPLLLARFDLSTIVTPSATDRYGFTFSLTDSKYEVTIKLNGDDVDLKSGTVWKKISGAKLYNQAVGGTAKMEIVYPTPIQFTSSEDELVITMTLQM